MSTWLKPNVKNVKIYTNNDPQYVYVDETDGDERDINKKDETKTETHSDTNFISTYVKESSAKIYESLHTHPQLIELVTSMRQHSSLVNVPWLNSPDLYYTRSLDNKYFAVSIYPSIPTFYLSHSGNKILVSRDLFILGTALKQDIFFPKISLFEINGS